MFTMNTHVLFELLNHDISLVCPLCQSDILDWSVPSAADGLYQWAHSHKLTETFPAVGLLAFHEAKSVIFYEEIPETQKGPLTVIGERMYI